MIHNEQKKWFLYSTLPPNINKLFIYMPTMNNPVAEKALGELADYLKTTLDTIGKVNRVDVNSCEGSILPVVEDFPLLVFDGNIITHNTTDIVKSVSNYLPVVELEPSAEERVKALKDGKDLL